mmetsp:Transcript_22528/g.29237  ORF Transcript_22528/g.29237 Transcript_22528/m.29237 type:complete len:457 (-) Transcript_22528:160-1530(-)
MIIKIVKLWDLFTTVPMMIFFLHSLEQLVGLSVGSSEEKINAVLVKSKQSCPAFNRWVGSLTPEFSKFGVNDMLSRHANAISSATSVEGDVKNGTGALGDAAHEEEEGLTEVKRSKRISAQKAQAELKELREKIKALEDVENGKHEKTSSGTRKFQHVDSNNEGLGYTKNPGSGSGGGSARKKLKGTKPTKDAQITSLNREISQLKSTIRSMRAKLGLAEKKGKQINEDSEAIREILDEVKALKEQVFDLKKSFETFSTTISHRIGLNSDVVSNVVPHTNSAQPPVQQQQRYEMLSPPVAYSNNGAENMVTPPIQESSFNAQGAHPRHRVSKNTTLRAGGRRSRGRLGPRGRMGRNQNQPRNMMPQQRPRANPVLQTFVQHQVHARFPPNRANATRAQSHPHSGHQFVSAPPAHQQYMEEYDESGAPHVKEEFDYGMGSADQQDQWQDFTGDEEYY